MDAEDLTSITTVNEDGTQTLHLFDTPIKYVDNGNIKFIDNTIKKVDNISEDSKVGLSGTLLTPIINTSGYTNTANCFAVNMPSTISEGVSLEYGDLKVSVFPAVLSSAYNIVGYHGSSYGTGIAMIKTKMLSDYTYINSLGMKPLKVTQLFMKPSLLQ